MTSSSSIYSVQCDENVQVNESVHFIPCYVDKDGHADVSKYFRPVMTETETLASSFRGRPLLGKKMTLPESYCGYVGEKLINNSQSECNTIHITHKFKDYTYWNLDLEPSQNDVLVKLMDWAHIAEALHCDQQEEVGINGENKHEEPDEKP